MILKIFRATDAFLYLPTYIAEQLGIFETVLGTLVSGVVFENSKGDLEAIKDMLAENNKSNTLSIAIADPVVFLSPRLQNAKDKISKDNIRVIGAIINRLPFWAVDHLENTILESIPDFRENFDSIIHCGSDYATGHYLGTLVRNQAGISGGIQNAEFGNEISTLNERSCERAVAITADIVSVVQAERKGLHINYKFSVKEGEHITTGVLTTEKRCNDNGEILDKIMESIQKAISILYCSSKTAENICAQLKETKDKNVDLCDIRRIIQLIQEEKFYPADLNITKESWDKAVKALSLTQQLGDEDKNIKKTLSKSFYKFVDNSFVLNSERHIAKQFGIDLDSFKLIDITKNILLRLFKWIFTWFKNALVLNIFIFLIFFILIFVCQEHFPDIHIVDNFALNLILNTIASILGARLFDLIFIKKKI